jgi:hypothetical protein
VPLLKATGLNKRDARDIRILRTVCDKLNFRVLFASVEKALGCMANVDYDKVQRWQQSRPKIEPVEDQQIMLDELVLGRIIDLDGSIVGNRVLVRDSEIVQEDPFSYESAKIETHDGEDNDVFVFFLLSSAILIVWRHASSAVVLVPPQNQNAFAIRQYFSLPAVRQDVVERCWLSTDLVGTQVIKHLLDKMTDQARKSNDSIDLRKLQETCGLLMEYLGPANSVYHSAWNPSRFPRLRNESYDRLAAVCTEFGSADTGRKAVELFYRSASCIEPTLIIKALVRLLHHTPTDDNFEKASSLVRGKYGHWMEEKIELCDKIITVCIDNQCCTR